jgi:hypothetical protein
MKKGQNTVDKIDKLLEEINGKELGESGLQQKKNELDSLVKIYVAELKHETTETTETNDVEVEGTGATDSERILSAIRILLSTDYAKEKIAKIKDNAKNLLTGNVKHDSKNKKRR